MHVRQNGLHYQEDLEVVHVKLTQAIKGIFSISVKLWQVIISFSDAFQEVEQNVQLNYWVEGSLENVEAKVVQPKKLQIISVIGNSQHVYCVQVPILLSKIIAISKESKSEKIW